LSRIIAEEADEDGDCQPSLYVQGPLASLAIGEVRISFRKQLSALLREYKFQLFIADVEIVLQKSVGTAKRRSKKSRSTRNPTSERRKWIVTANLSKYLKFSITELVLKVAEARLLFFLFALSPWSCFLMLIYQDSCFQFTYINVRCVYRFKAVFLV